MTTTQLQRLLKYYNGEEQCPYEVNTNGELWWHGEKELLEHCQRDNDFFNRIVTTLKNTINDGGCTGTLTDKTLPIEQRAIVFYLDLWHGKNYPYDDLDLINKY